MWQLARRVCLFCAINVLAFVVAAVVVVQFLSLVVAVVVVGATKRYCCWATTTNVVVAAVRWRQVHVQLRLPAARHLQAGARLWDRRRTDGLSVCLSVCYTLYSAGHYASKTRDSRDTIGHSRSYPKVWNTLPLNVRQISNTQTFKRNLKTFLFCTSYNILTPTLSPADWHSMWFSYCNCFIVFYCILAYFIMYFTA